VSPQPDGASRPSGAAAAPTRGPIVRALTERLPYKAAALFFAVTLWFVVASAETAERIVPVRISPRLDSGVVLVGEPPVARALVVGRARDLVKLGDAALVVRRVVTAETPDSVSFELRPSDVDLPARTTAVVRDVLPHVVTLHLAPALPRPH
jgi:hypothetical protein